MLGNVRQGIKYNKKELTVKLHTKRVDETMGTKTQQLDWIYKLYEGYFDTDQDTELFAKEFYYAVGEILQGKDLKDLKLRCLLLEEIL